MEQDHKQHFPESAQPFHCLLPKVVARVKSVMTHGAGFCSCLKIAEGLVNHREAGMGAWPFPLLFLPQKIQGGPYLGVGKPDLCRPPVATWQGSVGTVMRVARSEGWGQRTLRSCDSHMHTVLP